MTLAAPMGEGEIRIDQPRAERMAFEMVDREQRLARRERQALAGQKRNHHAADKPRAGGRSDRVHVVN